MATVKAPIGFVGLGHMGGNMAARLLEAGYAHRDIAAVFEILGRLDDEPTREAA
jgi:pyrroline-5-carboxylate reductase